MNEAVDVEAVVSYIKDANTEARVILWGRSMGAVAALLFMHRQHDDVSVVVLDSPFCNLKELVLHIGNSQTSLPKFML